MPYYPRAASSGPSAIYIAVCLPFYSCVHVPSTSRLFFHLRDNLFRYSCVSRFAASEDAEEDGDAQEIPLPNVKASVLSKVRGDRRGGIVYRYIAVAAYRVDTPVLVFVLFFKCFLVMAATR